MIKNWWLLPAVALIATVATGCASSALPEDNQPPAPAAATPVGTSGPVSDVIAICGVQGVYWLGTWWAVNPPIQKVRGETSTKTISGTMTATADRSARLDSPDLEAPQALWKTPNTREDAPPFQLCQPSVE